MSSDNHINPSIAELERARTLLMNQIRGAHALFGDNQLELQTSQSGLRIVEDLINSYYSDAHKDAGPH